VISKPLKHVRQPFPDMSGIAPYSLFLLLSFSIVQVQSQDIVVDPITNHKQYDFFVKQFDDFVERFNYKRDFAGKEILPQAENGPSRQSIIASLFNHDDPRIDKGNSSYSPEYEALALEFIQIVCRDSLHIYKNSEAVFASAETRGKFKEETVQFKIILRQEQVGKNMLKWVIWDIEAPFLSFLQEDTTYLRFLPPSSGDLDFKELRRAMKDLDYLHYYAHEKYNYDPLSVFFYLLHEGEIEIESIQEVKYRIYDIPGWCMILKDFNRDSKNAGWLMDDLYKAELPVKCK